MALIVIERLIGHKGNWQLCDVITIINQFDNINVSMINPLGQNDKPPAAGSNSIRFTSLSFALRFAFCNFQFSFR